VVMALYERRRARDLIIKGPIWGITALALVVVVWRDSQNGTIASGAGTLRFTPVWNTVDYFLKMFNGMQPPESPDGMVVVAWCGVLMIIGSAIIAQWSALRSVRTWLILLGLTVVAMFALPYQIGDYTFINLRVASIVYFLMALAAAAVPLGQWRNVSLAILLMACMITSGL